MRLSMVEGSQSYYLIFDFIRAFCPTGFLKIDRSDPLVLAVEKMMSNNNQFLSVFDMLRMKTLFVSQGSIQLLGIEPEELTSYHFKEATHPDDLKRHELGLVKMFETAHNLFVAKKGEFLISTNFRLRNITGNYTNQLTQCYFFYDKNPNDVVYLVNINTDIGRYKKIKHGFHYYIGTDLSKFRYPDEELLRLGHSLSNREFEIVKLIREGLDSEQISEKLFLSKHTVNKHRKNILNKTGKNHMADVLFYLHEQGVL